MLFNSYLGLLFVNTEWYTPKGIWSLVFLATCFFPLFPQSLNKVVIVTLSASCAEDRPGDIHNHQNLQTLAFYGLSSGPLFVLAKQSQP